MAAMSNNDELVGRAVAVLEACIDAWAPGSAQASGCAVECDATVARRLIGDTDAAEIPGTILLYPHLLAQTAVFETEIEKNGGESADEALRAALRPVRRRFSQKLEAAGVDAGLVMGLRLVAVSFMRLVVVVRILNAEEWLAYAERVCAMYQSGCLICGVRGEDLLTGELICFTPAGK